MKIFVTGATGYIGAYLVKKLAEQGHTVHALVRSPEKAKNISHSNIIFFKGDILDKVSVEKAMEGCEQVFHLAAFARVWAKDSKIFFDMNVLATNYILDAAKKFGVKKMVVTSSAGVFGPSLSGTITEKTAREIDFFNEYESSKALSESIIKDYVINGLDVVIVSPTRVYGPYLFGKTEAITNLIEKFVLGKWRFIPGDGKKTGNYVFVDDVIQGHLLAMEKGRKGETYIIGGRENHDYNQFFGEIAKHSGIKRRMIHLPMGLQMTFARIQLIKTWFGIEPPIVPKWINKGKYDWHVTPQKAIDELGLKPHSLEDGIKKTVNWLQSKQK